MSGCIRCVVGLALGVAVLTHGGAARAQEGVTPPAPAVVVVPAAQPVVLAPAPARDTHSGYHGTLVVSGTITFGLSYGAAVVVAATSDRAADQRLYVPVVGPWLDLADRGSCDVGNPSCDGETTNKVLIIADGVLQAAGVLAVIGGVLAPGGGSHGHSSTADTGVHVGPVSFGRGAPGIAAFGRF